jgi:hypothetical protein
MIIHYPKKQPKDYTQWNHWFAWFPVRINDEQLLWLEYVERKEIPKTYVNYEDWTTYEYRICNE